MSSTPVERRGLCLIIAAPSGTGKSSLTRALMAEEPGLALSVSVTTRPPRPGEVEGKHYYFRTPAEFEQLRASGGLLEWAHVFGRETLYGTPRAPVEAALARGQDMIFAIDWQGFRQMRAAMPGDVVGVFLLPPSRAALEQRLRLRGQDSEAEIARRMATTQSEMEHYAEFDYAVVNERFDEALMDLRSVLRAARLTTARQTGLPQFTRMALA
jgi:guanylate kinase